MNSKPWKKRIHFHPEATTTIQEGKGVCGISGLVSSNLADRTCPNCERVVWFWGEAIKKADDEKKEMRP